MSLLIPPIWLIIIIVGLPQLSETVYTPSLPEIAGALKTSPAMVEHTLTIYLFSFAIGTLFWGWLSDRLGRKPCVMMGLCVFILGCVGCYVSLSIEALMLSRFIQAFGGSIGSVLGQAICRDAFHGPNLGRAYASMSSALASFQAIGPIVGGFIADKWDWSNIFLFLLSFAVFLLCVVYKRLPETHQKENRQKNSVISVLSLLARDKKVIGLALVVAGCNGISFSYFAEGSFYLISLLNLSPTHYGLTFIGIAISTMLGGMTSRHLHKSCPSLRVMDYGLWVIFVSSVVFSISATAAAYSYINHTYMIMIAVLCQMSIMFGICMATSSSLALALVDYKNCIGTASSLFGFFYYLVISAFTFGMGELHNGTLIPMPFYFMFIAIFMKSIRRFLVKGA